MSGAGLRLAGVVAVAAVSALAPGARADSAPAGTSVVDGVVDRLPVGKQAPPPSDAAPPSIPSTERVDGVFLALTPLPKGARPPPNAKAAPIRREVLVYSTEAQASAVAASTAVPADERICFTGAASTSSHLTIPIQDGQVVAPIHKRRPHLPTAAVPPHQVIPLHVERLASRGDGATLETKDVWVDVTTLGVRARTQSSVELARVATVPNGSVIYATRLEEQHVLFVVAAPAAPEADVPLNDVQLASVESTSRGLTFSGDGTGASSDCGHVAIDVPYGAGVGHTRTVTAAAFLPPPVDGDAPADGDNSDGQDPTPRMRVRQVGIHMSVSQLPSEKSSRLSVTFGWASPAESPLL